MAVSGHDPPGLMRLSQSPCCSLLSLSFSPQSLPYVLCLSSRHGHQFPPMLDPMCLQSPIFAPSPSSTFLHSILTSPLNFKVSIDEQSDAGKKDSWVSSASNHDRSCTRLNVCYEFKCISKNDVAILGCGLIWNLGSCR